MVNTRIETLTNLSPVERREQIENQFQKNKHFFLRKYPSVAKVLPESIHAGPYRIQFTEEFLNIVFEPTGECCHPENKLDAFAKLFGDWTHQAWADLIDANYRTYTAQAQGQHTQIVNSFWQTLVMAFPDQVIRQAHKKVFLPQTTDGLRFSNSVCFIGLFHGLHIDYYLSRTEVINAAFVEPDAYRFIITCGFLDFEELEERFQGLILSVGNTLTENHLDLFMNKATISSLVWTRILPGYASDKIEPLMRKLRLKWRSNADSWFPFDQEVQGLINGYRNLQANARILSKKPKLSSTSRIAVIGSGPSLNKDLPWLHDNQDKLIICACHSAIRPLRAYGIKPDFQFNIEMLWTDMKKNKLQLDRDVPYVGYYKIPEHIYEDFDEVLLIAQYLKCDPVQFFTRVKYAQPTTGNMAFGLAAYCEPQTMYLLGLDFGFHDPNNPHAKGGLYDKKDSQNQGLRGNEQIKTPANFPDAGEIFTRPYWNQARLVVENGVAKYAGTIRFYNFSDGAKIKGARPSSTEDITLSPYPQKQNDIQKIKACFVPACQGEHWQLHEKTGAELLETFKEKILDHLDMPAFSWKTFARMIDACYPDVGKQIVTIQDLRMEPYLRLLHELLITWYRAMVFAHTPEEGEKIYETGKQKLRQIISELTWPDELP